jgi:predicted transcriptional regulator
MTYPNFFNFNLLTIKNNASLLLCFFIVACSSTEQVNNDLFSEKGYARGFINEKFSHTHFIPTNKNSIKKPMLSDHHLMLSLLNRPMTVDQAMMLAFEQERVNYGNTFANYSVEIKGEKGSDELNYRSENRYSKLIAQDINSINISAPN